MNAKKEKSEKSNTYTTQIGSVTGQVHTGTGNINVGSFSVGNIVSTKEEFLAGLSELRQALDIAGKEGLPEDAVDDASTELEAAEKEAKKETPKAGRILERLENAKAILIESAGVATAAATATVAVNKLIPLIEAAIQSVSKIF